jgi:hypothetical protein
VSVYCLSMIGCLCSLSPVTFLPASCSQNFSPVGVVVPFECDMLYGACDNDNCQLGFPSGS